MTYNSDMITFVFFIDLVRKIFCILPLIIFISFFALRADEKIPPLTRSSIHQYLPNLCKKSTNYWKKKLSNTPNNTKYINNLALCYFEEQEYRIALKYFQKLEILEALQPKSYLYQAMIYFIRNNDSTSRVYLKQVLKKKSNSIYPKALYIGAYFALYNNRKQKAKAYLEEFLSLTKDTPVNIYQEKALIMLNMIQGKYPTSHHRRIKKELSKQKKYSSKQDIFLTKYPYLLDKKNWYLGAGLKSGSYLSSQMIFRFNRMDDEKPYKFIKATHGRLTPHIKAGLPPSNIYNFIGSCEVGWWLDLQWDDYSLFRYYNNSLFNIFNLFSTDNNRHRFGLNFNAQWAFPWVSTGINGYFYWYHLFNFDRDTQNIGFISPWIGVRYLDHYYFRFFLRFFSINDKVNTLMTGGAGRFSTKDPVEGYSIPSIHLAHNFYFPQYEADLYVEGYYAKYRYNAYLYNNNVIGWITWLQVPLHKKWKVTFHPMIHITYESYVDSRIRMDLTTLKPDTIPLDLTGIQIVFAFRLPLFKNFLLTAEGFYLNKSPSEDRVINGEVMVVLAISSLNKMTFR